ncbi:hypothetical protein GGI07_002702 [Coemansia sp. Benny D115]|nr:hypothetical protein GGI07_002702 [Coemansia sp. Benny D115]
MSAATAEVQRPVKRTQGGRKGKAAWRKNIDLSTIESGLDEMRDDAIQGGRVTERHDSDLFVVDSQGDSKALAQQKQKKKLRLDEILDRRSKVPAAVVGKKMGEAQRQKIARQEERKRLKKIAGFIEGRKVQAEDLKAKETQGPYDLWGAAPPVDAKTANKKKAVSRQKMKHLDVMPAVEVAHPGASYMPDIKDHNELIIKATQEYSNKLKKDNEHSAFEGFTGLQPLDGLFECTRIIANEMLEDPAVESTPAGDASGNEDSESSDDEGDGDDDDDDETKTAVDGGSDNETVAPKAKKNLRKTRVQRNRERRMAKERVAYEAAQALKQQSKQLSITGRLQRHVDESVELSAEIIEKRREAAAAKLLKPRTKVGGTKVPQALEAVKLKEELPSSLRQLQPESNAFADVFGSLMKRNLVDPNGAKDQEMADRKNKKKYKMTEKWSYKDFK